MKPLHILLFTAILTVTHAQNRTVYLSDILAEAIFSQKDTIFYSNIQISLENIPNQLNSNRERSISNYLQSLYPTLQLDTSKRIVVPSFLELKSSSGDVDLDNLSFINGLSITDSDRLADKEISVFISNCAFNGLKIMSTNMEWLIIGQSQINHALALEPVFTSENDLQDTFALWDNDVNLTTGCGIYSTNTRASISKNRFKAGEDIVVEIFNNKELTISGNSFDSARVSIIQRTTIAELKLEGNSFLGPFIMDHVTVKDRAVIINNNFDNGFAMSQTLLPELHANFDWDQLRGNKLFINVDGEIKFGDTAFDCFVCIPYFGKSDEELARNDRFRELITVYTKLYRINKEDGDINSANGAYSELQDLYTRRYSYLYRVEGGLENWFKWRLNQLLEYYVVYGTAPARALVVSFYIILAFSIFYFFFPSEWDVTSKKLLLEQFKLALDKKHKQTARPLLKTIGLFALSFVNAFTLSLNSFVTLGFGTIPTTGLARYVCIVQGFIGWFLLSLFTVALINQVIF